MSNLLNTLISWISKFKDFDVLKLSARLFSIWVSISSIFWKKKQCIKIINYQLCILFNFLTFNIAISGTCLLLKALKWK